jgi:hypothetical protein
LGPSEAVSGGPTGQAIQSRVSMQPYQFDSETAVRHYSFTWWSVRDLSVVSRCVVTVSLIVKQETASEKGHGFVRATNTEVCELAIAPEFLVVTNKNKQTPWPLVRERTIPTERPPLVDEI